MEKFMEKISAIVEPLAEWMQNQKFLNALSETMQALLPITIVGSFACLFAFVDIKPWVAFLGAHPWVQVAFMNTQSWTLSIIAFYTVMLLPYLYAKRLGMKEPLATIPLNIGAFLLLTPTELYTAIPSGWLGHKGMFTAFLVTIVVVRFVKLCEDKNITIKMPEGVPHYIEATFAVLIPAVVLLFVCAFAGQLIGQTEAGSVHQIIYNLIQSPLQNLGTGFFGLLVTEFVMTLAMFCGVHGSSVVPFMTALETTANAENLAAIAANQPIPNIYGTGLLNSIQLGGIGATFGLAIVLLVVCKSKRYQQLARVAFVPQIFNIGEPILFGLPIMLNPMLFIPYMGGVLANTCIAYGCIATGLVGRPNGVNPSWTMPPVLQGILGLSTPVAGAIMQVAIIAIDILIWLPFIKIMDKQACAEEAEG